MITYSYLPGAQSKARQSKRGEQGKAATARWAVVGSKVIGYVGGVPKAHVLLQSLQERGGVARFIREHAGSKHTWITKPAIADLLDLLDDPRREVVVTRCPPGPGVE